MAGEAYTLTAPFSPYLAILTENTQLTAEDWQHLQQHPAAAELLCQLVNAGGWLWSQA